jgi:hypothetical protein
MNSAAMPWRDRPMRAENRLGLRIAGFAMAEAAASILTLIQEEADVRQQPQ